MHVGDLVFQFLIFAVLLGLIFAAYFGIRCLTNKQERGSGDDGIEEKLDRIIELLEKDKLD